MIKLVHFIHGLNTGGAETLVKNYMLNIDHDCFDTVLLCLRHEKKSPYELILKKYGIKVLYVEDEMFLKNSSCIIGILARIYRYIIVRRILRRENPDIVHTHLIVNKYIKFARLRQKIVLFHTVHNDPE